MLKENINTEINELDILAQIDEKYNQNINNSKDNDILNFLEEFNNLNKQTTPKVEINNLRKTTNIISFIIKYITTSAAIFILLMGLMNFGAYKSIALSYLDKDSMEQSSQKLLTAIDISEIETSNKKEVIVDLEKKKIEEIKQYNKEKQLRNKIENKKETTTDIEENKTFHAMKKLLYKTNSENIDFNINIAPYENRIIIPKIGKNIPLLDVDNKNIEKSKDLEGIFMEELNNGIVRYPGTAKPGENGNSFIFGHSSNLPWVEGNYNDVFALLDNVVYNDEVIVYYGQKQFKYKIKEKKVIAPGEVSVLERSDDKSEITLMTCWPIGTTLNRLIVVGELIK